MSLNQLGKQYVAGAAGPNRFDCSGFTLAHVYKRRPAKYLPHYSGAQMNRTRRVGVKWLKPGDLLFYGRGGSQHVSMYIGKGKMIHATNRAPTCVLTGSTTATGADVFAGAGRIIEG